MARTGERLGWRDKIPGVFAVLLTIVAVFCALGALSVPFRNWAGTARGYVDMILVPAPANLGYAVFVGILAAAVSRRKRVAWWILIVYFCFALLVNGLVLGATILVPDIFEDEGDLGWWTVVTVVAFTVAVAAIVMLALGRRAFYARVQRASLLRAVGVFAGLMAFFIVLGYGLVRLAPGSLDPGEKLVYAAEKVLGGAVRFDVTRDGHAPGWVTFILGLFGAIALFAALWTLFRSQRRTAALGVEEERRIRDLLHEPGYQDSLGYFATRRDKAVIFSPTGQAGVTYRVVAGVCLASGDPIGQPDHWPAAIEAWLDQLRSYAWTPAVMGASEEGAHAYHRAGLNVLELGDEAVVNVREFTLDGADMAPVRRAVHRVERVGTTARIRRHIDVPEAEMEKIVELADRWRVGGEERGFSMALSRLGDPSDAECVLVEAVDADGEVTGLLSFVPWGRDGLSLDLMRRRPDSDNGLMEFMVASLVAASPGLGIERISLNFAVFRSAFEEGGRIGAGPISRAWRRFLLFVSRWWQLESLYRSNVKYRPEWAPRFLCFGDRRGLARVGLASAVAEGFLAAPWAYGESQPRALELEAEAREYASRAGRPEFADLPDVERSEQERVRLQTLERLRTTGVDPYPVGVTLDGRRVGCAEIHERHGSLPPDTRTGETVALAGRVMRIRDHGGVCFATLRDWTGDLQVMLTERADLEGWRTTMDIGDHVVVEGEIATSRKGELSVDASSWRLSAKCLRPLPDKWRGMADQEAQVRQRYVDLVVNTQARDILRERSGIIRSFRESLYGKGFLEVETPILQPVHGGANARPFVTHINSYDMDLYLRIAPELYLKRLCVGGVERVFELGRTFRNEGVSYKHNPEFTMLEAYQAYADYMVMRDLTRDLVQTALRDALGTTVIRHGDQEYDLGGDWPTVAVNEGISRALGEEVSADTPVSRLRELADAHEIPYDPAWTHGALILELYEHLVESKTTVPTFYKDFPTEVSPLTGKHRDDPRLAEKWDLVAFGTELGTAYSELIDPVDQRRRLTEQSLLAAGGDPEAMEVDEDFLTALEYAMPPSGGLGIGVDRIVMLLTDRTIRQTLPFPLVRPSAAGATGPGGSGGPGASGVRRSDGRGGRRSVPGPRSSPESAAGGSDPRATAHA